jgi:hypothetical protein
MANFHVFHASKKYITKNTEIHPYGLSRYLGRKQRWRSCAMGLCSRSMYKTLLDLDRCDCRFPVGRDETEDRNMLFCSEPQADGSLYCEHHKNLCASHDNPVPAMMRALAADKRKSIGSRSPTSVN